VTLDSSENARSVGLVGAISIGIGGMVGGGIFAVLGVAATRAGGATPLAFLVGGVVAGLTAFSYSKLSVKFQSEGGTVIFIDRVFRVSDLTGSLNIVLWAGYIATTALYASAFGNYGSTFFSSGETPNMLLLKTLVVVGVGLPWFINLTNAGLVSRSESFIVAIKLTILLVVVVAGVPSIISSRLSTDTWPSAVSVIAAGMLIFVAYEGFELISNASADVRRPLRNLPLAFAISVGLVVLLYVAISIVVVGSLDPSEIVASADFALAEAASASLGQFGFTLVAISAVLATASAINATLYGSARLSFTIAAEGELPVALERKTWDQPIGLHITALGGAAIAVALPLESISGIASAIFLIVFAVVNAAAFRLGETAITHRVIAAVGALGCIASLLVLLGESVTEDPAAVVGLAVMLVLSLGAEHLYMKHARE
jgi:amino acid transporter